MNFIIIIIIIFLLLLFLLLLLSAAFHISAIKTQSFLFLRPDLRSQLASFVTKLVKEETNRSLRYKRVCIWYLKTPILRRKDVSSGNGAETASHPGLNKHRDKSGQWMWKHHTPHYTDRTTKLPEDNAEIPDGLGCRDKLYWKSGEDERCWKVLLWKWQRQNNEKTSVGLGDPFLKAHI